MNDIPTRAPRANETELSPELATVDLHDYGPRLRRLAIAAALGLILTFFSVKAMTSSGRGPNEDPVGTGSVGMLAFAMFVVTTGFVHKILSKHRARTSR
jgi:hypothetical protein